MCIAKGCILMSLEVMPPEEDARAILPLTHDLGRLQLLAQTQLPEELLELQDFAVKARYSPEDTPLPASREQLLARIRQLRLELERLLVVPQQGSPSAGA